MTDIGRSPDGSGYSAEPEPSCTVSAVPVSIPNAEITYPPEMLPDCPDADVVVCMGCCGNEPPCALCVIIRPGDDPDMLFGGDA